MTRMRAAIPAWRSAIPSSMFETASQRCAFAFQNSRDFDGAMAISVGLDHRHNFGGIAYQSPDGAEIFARCASARLPPSYARSNTDLLASPISNRSY